jgi:uncharacterized membrane protein
MIFLTLAINCSRIYLENISARSNMCTDLSFVMKFRKSNRFDLVLSSLVMGNQLLTMTSQYHHQSGESNLTMTQHLSFSRFFYSSIPQYQVKSVWFSEFHYKSCFLLTNDDIVMSLLTVDFSWLMMIL